MTASTTCQAAPVRSEIFDDFLGRCIEIKHNRSSSFTSPSRTLYPQNNMPISLKDVEQAISTIVKNNKGHDTRLFHTRVAYRDSIKRPTINIKSNCGPSGSLLDREYTGFGLSLTPKLTWTNPHPIQVKQWVLICECPDTPSTHGVPRVQ